MWFKTDIRCPNESNATIGYRVGLSTVIVDCDKLKSLLDTVKRLERENRSLASYVEKTRELGNYISFDDGNGRIVTTSVFEVVNTLIATKKECQSLQRELESKIKDKNKEIRSLKDKCENMLNIVEKWYKS